MDGSDFLTVARELAEMGDEAHCRSSVSRAYYGAYHLARRRVEDAGVVLEHTARDHQTIYLCLLECGLDAMKKVAHILHSLRAVRNKADYDLTRKGWNQNKARLEIKNAELLAQCLADGDAAILRAGIRDYALKVKLEMRS